MSKSKMPPIPSGELSGKGPKAAPERTSETGSHPHNQEGVPNNLKEQDHQANIAQNTTARGRNRH